MAKASEARRDNRSDAVALCQAGFAIYPLLPGTKIPAIASPHPCGSPERGRCRGQCGLLGHGYYDARADVQWADRYWSVHPAHGVAARPGLGQFVLDVDSRHGGDVGLAELEARYGMLPKTFTVITGRGDGGRHLWFTGLFEPLHSKLCPGVDVISHNRGGVVMPPSLHQATMRPYCFEPPLADIAAVPEWLRERLAMPRPEPSGILSRPVRRMSPSQARRRGRGLVDIVANAAAGQRHIALYWAARRAAEEGLLDVEGYLDVDLADAARDAGLAPDEIERTVTDAVMAARAGGGW